MCSKTTREQVGFLYCVCCKCSTRLLPGSVHIVSPSVSKFQPSETNNRFRQYLTRPAWYCYTSSSTTFFMLSTEVHQVRVDVLCFVRKELCTSSCILFSSSSELQTLGDEPPSYSLRQTLPVTRRIRVCRYGNQRGYSASIAKTRKRSPHQHIRQL